MFRFEYNKSIEAALSQTPCVVSVCQNDYIFVSKNNRKKGKFTWNKIDKTL